MSAFEDALAKAMPAASADLTRKLFVAAQAVILESGDSDGRALQGKVYSLYSHPLFSDGGVFLEVSGRRGSVLFLLVNLDHRWRSPWKAPNPDDPKNIAFLFSRDDPE